MRPKKISTQTYDVGNFLPQDVVTAIYMPLMRFDLNLVCTLSWLRELTNYEEVWLSHKGTESSLQNPCTVASSVCVVCPLPAPKPSHGAERRELLGLANKAKILLCQILYFAHFQGNSHQKFNTTQTFKLSFLFY